MTQAQFAGGADNAPQALPAKGQLFRDFILTSTRGQQISLSDYRGRSSLVVVFVGGEEGDLDLKVLTEVASGYARFREEQAEVLAILPCSKEYAAQIAQQADLPFPILVDEHGRFHRSVGAVDTPGRSATALYITDSFGEVYGVYDAAKGQAMPDAREITKWLAFISMQCPECGHPEW